MDSDSLRSNPYGWTVVLVSFIALSLVFSARSSLGLLMPVWQADLGWSRQFVSTGGAAMLVTMAVVAPLGGYLVDRFGPRMLYAGGLAVIAAAVIATAYMSAKWQFLALFCGFGGVGFALIAVPLVSTAVAVHFEERRGFATGIATAGVSGGQLLILPLLAWLVTTIGWRDAYWALGAVIAAMALVALCVVRSGNQARAIPVHLETASDTLASLRGRLGHLARSRTFWPIAGGYVICGFTTTGVIKVHLLPYAADSGFPLVESAAALGVLSAFNVVGIIAAGWLCDRMNRSMLLTTIYFVRALSFILLMYIAADISLLFIFAVIFGLFDYATVPVISSLVASHIGVRVMGLTLGILFAGHSAGGAVGAFLGGWMFDFTGGYVWVWTLAMATAVVASALSLLIPAAPADGGGAAVAQPAGASLTRG